MLKGFNTKILHTHPSRKDSHGAIQYPIYATSAFEFESAEDIADAFQNIRPAFAYSRSGNPTIEFFEHRIKNITDANQVIACASGMAAVSSSIMAICNQGDNIIISPKMFGNTVALFIDTFQSLGIEIRLANFNQVNEITKLIDSNTRMVFFEVLNNPFLEIVELEALRDTLKNYPVVICADTTLTPPNIFQAQKWGINLSIMSSTKYISDGGVSVGGLIIDHGTFDWTLIPKLKSLAFSQYKNAFAFKVRKEIIRNTGACLSPFNAFLQSLGLETLSLRFNRMNDNALQIAQWLSNERKVKKVNYPALSHSPYFSLCQKYLQGKAGGLLTFELDNQHLCFEFMNKLKIIKRATNINDNRTLIIHPLSTIYSDFNEELLKEIHLSDSLLRLSVGIEDVDDLIEDLSGALIQ